VSAPGRRIDVSLPRLGRLILRSRRRDVAWALAVVGPTLVTAGSRWAGPSVPPASVLFLTMLIVLCVALLGGARPALTAVVAGLVAQEVFFGFPYGSLDAHQPAQLSVLVAFVIVGAVVGTQVGELGRLTEEQTALRRIAILVATEASTDELFTAVSAAVGQLLSVNFAGLGRFEPDGTMIVVASWTGEGERFSAGAEWAPAGEDVGTLVAQSGRPARLDSIDAGGAPGAGAAGETGFRSTVGTPITVHDRLWGVVIVGSTRDRRLPADTEARLAAFVELLSTAIANAESCAELAASRARVLDAGDDMRRRIERDLHDGAQQQLVSLGLRLRAAQATLPPELGELDAELSSVVESLAGVQDELREMARGIHPASLSEGGLGPALKTLSRRCPIAVELEVQVGARLPQRIEVATYYVVSESLTNSAKHADASVVHVDVGAVDGAVHVLVRDDGAGGADPARGSGLIGLRDRIEALGGTITVQSPLGAGTSVYAELPLGGRPGALPASP
jgi:signal transduction histidine kinase